MRCSIAVIGVALVCLLVGACVQVDVDLGNDKRSKTTTKKPDSEPEAAVQSLTEGEARDLATALANEQLTKKKVRGDGGRAVVVRPSHWDVSKDGGGWDLDCEIADVEIDVKFKLDGSDPKVEIDE